MDCGYSNCVKALEFHHRDPQTKEFGLGQFDGSLARLLMEAEKCDLLCANCHRLRHAAILVARVGGDLAAEDTRRVTKARAVVFMGGRCFGCEIVQSPEVFEFHHLNASDKEFGISQDGVLRSWQKIAAELAKCVMLCANCHREVHAGMRVLDEGLLGLAEDALAYVA
jgi:hypothetical protein